MSKMCESCAVADLETRATTHSVNPDWSQLDLCEECAAEYDSRDRLQTRADDRDAALAHVLNKGTAVLLD